jgi:2-oxoglutarate ferredoxin oxidoreductase subunit delta
MAKGEITIDEMMCQGCGYCAKFCSRGCIVISGDKMSARGYLVPVFTNHENCNACAVCGWMCPHMAIEVYRIEEEEAVKS